MLCVLSNVSLGERVKLDPEGDALLSTVLPGSELCADAVHLQTMGRQEHKCHQNMLHAFEVEIYWHAQQIDGTKES